MIVLFVTLIFVILLMVCCFAIVVTEQQTQSSMLHSILTRQMNQTNLILSLFNNPAFNADDSIPDQRAAMIANYLHDADQKLSVIQDILERQFDDSEPIDGKVYGEIVKAVQKMRAEQAEAKKAEKI